MVSPSSTRVRVKEVMTPRPICISEDADLQELAEVFDANGISGVPVIDSQERVIGVVSKTDIIHRCLEGPLGSPRHSLVSFIGLARDSGLGIDLKEMGTVADFMTPDPVTTTEDQSLADVARLMVDERVHRVVVIDPKKRALGIVTTLDLLKHWQEDKPS